MTALKNKVYNRGAPPDAFLVELVKWGRKAPADLFAMNDEPQDTMNKLVPYLGPWTSHWHRRAAMLECLRVLAGFESSWNWTEGKDTTATNPDPASFEAGAWQLSYDCVYLDTDIADYVHARCGKSPAKFQATTKSDHVFAMHNAAMVLRVTYRHHGPLRRSGANSVYPWLSRDSMQEFQGLLKQ